MGAFRLGETATEFELAVNDSADHQQSLTLRPIEARRPWILGAGTVVP